MKSGAIAAWQYPAEIPGFSLQKVFLCIAISSIVRKKKMSIYLFGSHPAISIKMLQIGLIVGGILYKLLIDTLTFRLPIWKMIKVSLRSGSGIEIRCRLTERLWIFLWLHYIHNSRLLSKRTVLSSLEWYPPVYSIISLVKNSFMHISKVRPLHRACLA